MGGFEMKSKCICLNRSCDSIFYKRIKNILDKIRCPKCGWRAQELNGIVIMNTRNTELWISPRKLRV